jgi:hypothetical protein
MSLGSTLAVISKDLNIQGSGSIIYIILIYIDMKIRYNLGNQG